MQNHLFSCQRSGHFTVCQDEDGKIRMNFPIRQPELITEYPEALRQALTKPLKMFI